MDYFSTAKEKADISPFFPLTTFPDRYNKRYEEFEKMRVKTMCTQALLRDRHLIKEGNTVASLDGDATSQRSISKAELSPSPARLAEQLSPDKK